MLLDPVDVADPALLSFNVEGRAIAAAQHLDEWDRKRVAYSVSRYNLDFPPLMDKRKTVWGECWIRIQEYLQELAIYSANGANIIARDRSKQAAKAVRAMLGDDQELSAVARACVLSTGDPRVVGLLQSA